MKPYPLLLLNHFTLPFATIETSLAKPRVRCAETSVAPGTPLLEPFLDRTGPMRDAPQEV
jgi:hypothetical protein